MSWCATGRLRGDVCNPDYDFLDPRLAEFYEGLTTVVNVRGWIHGLEAVTLQLSTAWHEVAVMQRLFPALPGMSAYTKTLRRITGDSNRLLIGIVEDLSYVFSDGKENPWIPDEVEASRKSILEEFITERDAFVAKNESILLDVLGQPCS